MKERLLQMTAREYSASQRTVALFFEGLFFMLLLPLLLAWPAGPSTAACTYRDCLVGA